MGLGRRSVKKWWRPIQRICNKHLLFTLDNQEFQFQAELTEFIYVLFMCVYVQK